jgi:tetratricopeptide (TPR) repeat protein
MTERENRFDALLEQGRQAFNDGNFGQALDAFDEAYDMQQTAELNQLIAKALLADGQTQTAMLFVDEFVDAYLETPESAELYTKVALANRQFLAVREFISWLPEEWQVSLMRKVIDAEQDVKQNMAQTQRTIARQFYHLSDGDPLTQRDRLTAAEKLSLDDYVAGARFLLVDPFLSPILRVTVLDRMRRLQVADQVKFLWLDEKEYDVIPAKLLPLSEMPIFRRIQAGLQAVEREVGPGTVEALQENNRLMLTLAYPFITEVVTDSAEWVAGTLAENFGTATSSENAQQRVWREKLQAEVMNLMP